MKIGGRVDCKVQSKERLQMFFVWKIYDSDNWDCIIPAVERFRRPVDAFS